MKKILIAVLAAVALLFAESYQVNTLSAKQMGMAHTGAGIKLGSESMNFNPGGLGFLNKTLDVSAGATVIIPEVEFKDALGITTVSRKIGVPFYFYAASSITDRFSAGLSFTTPYENSVDYGKGWEGAGILQSASLSVYALQPTVAFKPISQLSIGAGPAIYFGSYERNQRLFPNNYVDAKPLAAGTFSGDADVNLAVNAGIMYDVLQDKLTLGVGYRSEAKMKVSKGKTEVNYASEAWRDTLMKYNASYYGVLEASGFETELPLPANLNTGVSFRPIDKLLLAFDWQWIFWSAYSREKYHNTFAYRLGAQYTFMDPLDVRLGVYYDESPVDDDYLTLEFPSTDKLGFTTGLSYRLMQGFSIDASLLFATSLGSRSGLLQGSYKSMAFAPSVGVNYGF